MLTDQDLWLMYVQGLISAQGLPPEAGKNFVLCGTTLPANLATSSTSLGLVPTAQQALAQIYSLGDQLLTQTGIYTQAGDSFFSNYATYIDNLNPRGGNPSPSMAAALVQDRAAVAKAQQQYSSDVSDAYAAYQQQLTMFPGKWTGFQDYINSTGAASTLQASQSAVNAANAQLNADMTAAFGQDYAAISHAKAMVDQVRADLTASKASTPAEMTISTDTGTLVVPSYVPSSLAQFSNWADTMAVAPARQQPPAVSMVLKAGAQQYDKSQSQYFSQSGWSGFFVGGSSTHSGQALQNATNSSEFRIEITFQGITTVSLQRGPWYDSSLMYAYPNPRNLSLPTSLVVAMLPKVTLHLSASDYKLVQQASQESSGFGIGPFYASNSASSSSSISSSWNDSAQTVTLQQNNVQPIILGMTVSTPSSTQVSVSAKAPRQSSASRFVHLPLSRVA